MSNHFPKDIHHSLDMLKLNAELLALVWAQLDKDVSLCGLSGFSEVKKSDVDVFLNDLTSFVAKIKAHDQQWASLVYRVDLPSNVDYSSMSTDEMASLFAMRALQKVWLRKHFSAENDIQDDGHFLWH